MSATFKLPPTARDFDLFRAICVAGDSTRAAAAAFKISQTRVRQIITRVGQWLAESLPEMAEMATEKVLRLAEHLAADRLDYMYGQLMRMWTATSAPKYLAGAARMALALSRHGIVGGKIEALAADATLGPLPDDVWEEEASPPPVEDCSPAADPAPMAAAPPAAVSAAKSSASGACSSPAATETSSDPTFQAMLRTLRSAELTPRSRRLGLAPQRLAPATS